MLNKIILGGVITAVIIIIVVGLVSGIGIPENLNVNDQPINQEPHIPKKITLDLTDGMNMGEPGR